MESRGQDLRGVFSERTKELARELAVELSLRPTGTVKLELIYRDRELVDGWDHARLQPLAAVAPSGPRREGTS